MIDRLFAWVSCDLQAYLEQSEGDRKAAEEREAAAVSKAQEVQRSVYEAEDALKHAKADLEVSTTTRSGRRRSGLRFVCAGLRLVLSMGVPSGRPNVAHVLLYSIFRVSLVRKRPEV